MKQLIIFSFIILLVFLFGCKVEVDDSYQSTTGTAGELTIDPEADKLLKQIHLKLHKVLFCNDFLSI